ncbi:MAG: lytic transglycosylase domain-containing protein [Clostridium sp.]|nr:lytic transglycosylase domain-containing protein [Clostridium sp.]
MKIKDHILAAAVSISAAAIIAAILISGTSGVSAQEAPAPQSASKAEAAHAAVINPEVPEAIEFCGKEVSLDRADMYERFDRELASLIYTHGNTLLTIKRANKYFPTMAPILKEHGVPADVLYLACVESYLSPRAYSPAKAAGIWQFIPTTAKEYGLEVSDEVDERYNLEKATAAACRYLKKAYRKYGNWESVMAAYNGGTGRISRELEKQSQDSSFDLYLTEETSRYVFRIMAMKQVMENPSDYGFSIKAHQLYMPAECEIEEVSGPVADWAAWAGKRGISYAQLREENPWIRSKALTNKAGKSYKVRVPKAESLSRKTQRQAVYNPDWAQ